MDPEFGIPTGTVQSVKEHRQHQAGATARRKVVRVGAITIATGIVAGSLYVTMPSTASACPSPPCGTPGASPP
jgi:hypothetical protein